MTLDVPTLLVVATLVILTSSGMFLAEARAAEAVDRLWSLAFVAAIATALAYLGSTLYPGLWWANAVGNAASVLVVWTMWSGIRAYDERRSLIHVSVGVALLAAGAVLLQGPGASAWAGGWAALAGTAAGALLAGAAILRGPLRGFRSGALLAVTLLAGGAYYAVRLLLYVVEGPYSRAFETYAGTAATTLVNVLLVNGATFAALAIRTRDAQERAAEHQNFDPMTGARTNLSFEPRTVAQLRRSAESCSPAAMLEIVPEGVEALETAFGRPYADAALVTCGEIAQTLLPPRAIMGLDPGSGRSFQVLVPGWDEHDAVEWATQVRKELIDTPVEVPGSRVRVTVSTGIATAHRGGYDLGDLCDAAREASLAAVAEGGNRVRVSTEKAHDTH
ncbi:GGDEF domain-containing protein [Georgenia sp. AZ-5]|uniref:GGDEF domain-containing protein n=1 Tax=Georgenia sp. AZ-5 TaxID=3367526 RepID=UPI003754E53F